MMAAYSAPDFDWGRWSEPERLTPQLKKVSPLRMTSERSSQDALKAALAEFDDLGEDVLRSDHVSFGNNLKRLVTFHRENEFTHKVFSRFKLSSYEGFMMAASASVGTMSGRARLDWPADTRERIYLQTRLLTDLADRKIELFSFLEDFYCQSGEIEKDLLVFKEQLVRPYLRDYRKQWSALGEILVTSAAITWPPIPDFSWYSAESKRLSLSPRCPFANVHACPRYYHSLGLLGEAGMAPDRKRCGRHPLFLYLRSRNPSSFLSLAFLQNLPPRTFRIEGCRIEPSWGS